ncbi:hypothetical protein PsorP6_012392 [Peronosclerospora sorghi]|uniref:Uncharacterized protein n=1 Tax=Peronosclerospora sorghi TaxID=230839 RepID=A0ACC0WGG3_9STRA|nr:hypothetical protein PsorP6_012392 [Peronosclerospora sorghi]
MTERRLDQPGNLGEMTASIYGGRYMLFMMGAFAIYAGVIHNDFSSLPLNLFGSKFACPDDCLDSNRRDVKFVAEYKIQGHMTYVNATDISNGDNVYAVGLDPIRKTSSNELLYFNSFKMKILLIFGIFQMTFGILLKVWNSLYFREYATFFFESVLRLVFAVSLFF